MGQMYAFHKTAHGYGHIQNGQPCEDASASWCDGEGRFSIAIVADGHGQARSFRSAAGSRIAADTAVECLKEMALSALGSPEEEEAFYHDLRESRSGRLVRIRQLTDTIIARWHDGIRADYESEPPDEAELGEFAEYYRDAGRIPEIYGTTLIAALCLPKCLVLLQQGDGRCDVFYEDGTVDQPIPWDERCQGNVCTSICQRDACDSIRHCIIDLEEKQVIACYLGSDGVEDAYRDQEGTHIFYKDLSCVLCGMDEEHFDAYLEEMLPDFSARGRYSQSGSKDDVSVAGIVDVERLRPLVLRFQKDIQRFELEEKLLYTQTKLSSKTRKHGILDRRRAEARDKVYVLREEEKKLEAERDKLLEIQRCAEEKIRAETEKLETAQANYRDYKDYVDESGEPEKEKQFGFIRFFDKQKKFMDRITRDADSYLTQFQNKHEAMLAKKKELDERIGEVEARLSQCRQAIEDQQEAADQSELEFRAYDAAYREVEAELADVQAELEALNREEG